MLADAGHQSAGDLRTSVARVALVVLGINLVSRVLGFARDAVIAHQFGASRVTDAYLVAYTLPYALQSVLGMAVSLVVLPVVTRYYINGQEQEGWQVSASLVNLSVLVLGVLTVAGVAGAGFLVRILAPGFDPQQQQLAASLTRIMFPSLVFMGVGMLLTGILNAYQRFKLPALAPAVSNLIVIIAILVWGGRYRAEGLAVGTLLGFVGFLLVQLPQVFQLGFRPRRQILLHHPVVRQVGWALLPVLLGVAVNQLYLTTNRFLASGLVEGSISALDYANRVINLPLGIFVAAVATAVFPALARQAQGPEQRQAMAQTIGQGLFLVLLVSIPASIGLAVLREPVIKLLFQRGAFEAQAAALTAGALLYFAPGLPAMGANMVLTRAYYARGDVWTPVTTGMGSVALNILLSVSLRPVMGANGLALANSLAVTLYALLLYRRLMGYYDPAPRLAPTLLKLLLAGAVMGGVLLLAGGGLGAASWGQLMIFTMLLIIMGAVSYGLVAWALRIPEIKALKLKQTKRQPDSQNNQ